MSQRDESPQRTRAQRLAIPLMSLSALGQAIVGLIVSVFATVSLGAVAYADLTYRGGLTSTSGELFYVGMAAIVVVLASLVLFVSTVSTGYAAAAITFGWRGAKPYVACGVSVVGPIGLAGVGSLPTASLGALWSYGGWTAAVIVALGLASLLLAAAVLSIAAAALSALALGQPAGRPGEWDERT